MSMNWSNYNSAFDNAWNKSYGGSSMDPMTAGVIVGGAVNAASQLGTGITQLVNNKYNKEQNEWNKNFAREQFEYQKDLNQQIMDREDTAVQRRAQDLEAAGLSKTLAAGSSAQAQVMSGGHSGQIANGQGLNAWEADIMRNNLAMQVMEAKKGKAETAYLNQQAITEAEKQGLLREQSATELTRQNLNNSIVDLNQSQVDLNEALKELHRSNVDLNIVRTEAQKWDNFISVINENKSGEGVNSGGPMGIFKNMLTQIFLNPGAKPNEQVMKQYRDYHNDNRYLKLLEQYGIDTEEKFLNFLKYYKAVQK